MCNMHLKVVASSILLCTSLATAGGASARADELPEVRGDATARLREEQYQQAEAAASARAMDQLLARARSAEKLCDQATDLNQATLKRFSDLPSNEEGKRLGSTLDEYSSRDVMGYLEAPGLEIDLVVSAKLRSSSILEQLTQQREQLVPGYVPPPDLLSELDALSATARDQIAKLRARNEWLDQQLAGVDSRGDFAAALTLHDVLMKFKWEQFQKDAADKKIAAAKAQAATHDQVVDSARQAESERILAKANRELTDARAEIARQQADFEARLQKEKDSADQLIADLRAQLAKNGAARQKQDAQTTVTVEQGKQDAQEILLEQKCRDPHLRALLAPFITPGHWVGQGREVSLQMQPMSLSVLRQKHALDPTSGGLSKLIELARDKHDADRPRWGMDSNIASLQRKNRAGFEDAVEAQQALIELGPTLVRLHDLQP